MKLDFIKMHGCGNDYIYIDCFKYTIKNPGELSKKLSERHFYIGGDGLILVCPSDKADAAMRMFNADGSEGKMCGNGIRCAAKFVYDNGISKNNPLFIETPAGIKKISLEIKDGKAYRATVDMGAPSFDPESVPVKSDSNEPIIGKTIFVGTHNHKVTCLSMGNPHCVLFVPHDFDLKNFDIQSAGPRFENDPIFPERVNTEFVKFIDKTHLEMRVWERGSGETWACGTGTCATVVAACENGLCDKNTDITVKLLGGELVVRYTDKTVYMTGEAVEAFRGVIDIDY